MSEHGSRALLLAAIGLVAGGVLLWWLAGRPSDVADLAEAVATAEPGEVIRVEEVLEHEWRALHVFAPYTPPHIVEAAVGERVAEVRGLTRDEVMLVVLTDDGEVTASGLVARAPVDWFPTARERPYPREEAVFRVEPGEERPVLEPAGEER